MDESKFSVRIAPLFLAGLAFILACGSGSNAASKPQRTASPGDEESPASVPAVRPTTAAQAAANTDIHKIEHVVVIMQENRSYDSYFGTYPGGEGFPMANGQISVCVNDPKTKQCV